MRQVNHTFTALFSSTRNSTSRTRGSSTSRILTEDPYTIPIVRSPEGTLTWQTTSPREEYSRNEDYLELQEEVLRRLGIQSGVQSSRSLHPSPNSSPEPNMNNHLSLQHNSEIWSMLQQENGQIPQLCIHPDGHISLMYLRPLEHGQTPTSSP
nr:C3 protein [Trifolium virus 1]